MKNLSQFISEMDRKEKNIYNQHLKQANKKGNGLDLKMVKDMSQKRRNKLGLSTKFKKSIKEEVENSLNETLEQVSSVEHPDIWSLLETIKETCSNYGLEMPTINTLESLDFGEEVFEIDEDCYLYFAYSLNETNQYETVVCVVNEEELEELLSED